jgi:hypothetical protein
VAATNKLAREFAEIAGQPSRINPAFTKECDAHTLATMWLFAVVLKSPQVTREVREIHGDPDFHDLLMMHVWFTDALNRVNEALKDYTKAPQRLTDLHSMRHALHLLAAREDSMEARARLAASPIAGNA